MAIVINGSGTVTGISVGGLPDGVVDAGTLATNSVDSAELIDGSIDNSHLADDAVGTDELANDVAISTSGAITTTGTFTANSSSSGDYVRMYGSSGTGKWDIYGNGTNLRFSDNDSAGSVVFDRQINASGGVAIGGTGAANTLDDYEEGT